MYVVERKPGGSQEALLPYIYIYTYATAEAKSEGEREREREKSDGGQPLCFVLCQLVTEYLLACGFTVPSVKELFSGGPSLCGGCPLHYSPHKSRGR